ncbi:ORMDL-domain-containing protein [Lindgomyces ingoldianus]|uniref:ORMDL-domain-containing protein n=1 Tax=Lindgomyces ingoldianus TaxID=673940 RepID=A0ACB6QN99_9PLEO|nr:ORMDL-domain-containing protein [Lindgomyces ingoldianus]KAF2468463.1 ORMDL-domain-containing protein [Lindgomyces ingoldianus]
MPFDAKEARRRRSSSLVYTEPPESLEHISDQSALPNLNADWVNAKGAWAIHFVLIVLAKILFDIIPGVSQETSWTLTNISYMFGSYLMFHYVRGVPFDFNAGAYDNLNMWEQIDNGDQYTPAKKFLLSVPILLFLISTHYTHYDLVYFTVNCLATIAVILPKLPVVSRCGTITTSTTETLTGLQFTIDPDMLLGFGNIMLWSQIEPTPPHLTYLVLTFFLLLYALFSLCILNRLHLSEPPLATVFGILVGPRGLGILTPYKWGFTDNVIQEFARIVSYFTKAWKSIGVLLGPVMTSGWIICASFISLLFETNITTALIISACLAPADPVLAASVLSNSQFSTRVVKRIRKLLSAESGYNDGISFPFLYIGLSILTRSTFGGFLKKWLLITILYQCVMGTTPGLVLGYLANRIYIFSHHRGIICPASYLATLSVDDFLVAFSAGLGFSHAGKNSTADTRLPVIIDLMLSSTMLVFFSAMVPWASFTHVHTYLDGTVTTITPLRLLVCLALILFFRRISIVYALYSLHFLPKVQTTSEALFCGHFGPMGVGALFLAIEAHAQLETDTSLPLPHPPVDLPIERQKAMVLVWPVTCFMVLGMLGGHFSRQKGERAPLIGAEREGLSGMVFDGEDGRYNTHDTLALQFIYRNVFPLALPTGTATGSAFGNTYGNVCSIIFIPSTNCPFSLFS